MFNQKSGVCQGELSYLALAARQLFAVQLRLPLSPLRCPDDFPLEDDRSDEPPELPCDEDGDA